MTRTSVAALLLLAAASIWTPGSSAAEMVGGHGSPAAADSVPSVISLAEAREAGGEPLKALSLLHQALAIQPAGADAARLFEKAHALLQGLDDARLAEAASLFKGTPLGQDALLQQASRAATKGQLDVAIPLAEGLAREADTFPYGDQAVELWEELNGKFPLQRAIGVLLPFSGRFASFGELVRRGMDLALEMHEAQGKKAVRFVYRDAGADPDLSSRAVSELADVERVMAIAGPLAGAEAEAAALQAQQARIPLLSLSQREGIPGVGEYVFRDSLTSRQQVRALVAHAMGERNLRSFAILHPESKQGREMAELFAREVESRGGRVVEQQDYAEKETDFRRPIRLLQGESPDTPEAKTSPPVEAPVSKTLPFEALFIPDYADQIALIAPQLAFYGIEGIPLLGINSWNSPDLVRLAGRFVEGAIFVDGFFPQSPYPFVRDFVDRYIEKYGEEPSILEAQGYDVAGILLSLLDQPEIRTRDDLRLALSRLQNYRGVTGATSFDHLGDAEKVLFLLQVQNGAIVQIN